MKSEIKKLQVLTDGIMGDTWVGGQGFLPRSGVIYDSSMTERKRQSLAELCDNYLARYGGDFQFPMLAGLYMTTVHESRTAQGSVSQYIRKVKTYIPCLTPELQQLVACDVTEPQPLALARVKPVVIEWDLLDEWDEWDADFFVEELDDALETFWDGVEQYMAPASDETDMPWNRWTEWAGRGYFKVQAHNIGWQRRSGDGNPRKLEDGRALWEFANQLDLLGHAKFTFYGDCIEIAFSGHDTMGGLITLTPCPDWAWVD